RRRRAGRARRRATGGAGGGRASVAVVAAITATRVAALVDALERLVDLAVYLGAHAVADVAHDLAATLERHERFERLGGLADRGPRAAVAPNEGRTKTEGTEGGEEAELLH